MTQGLWFWLEDAQLAALFRREWRQGIDRKFYR